MIRCLGDNSLIIKNKIKNPYRNLPFFIDIETRGVVLYDVSIAKYVHTGLKKKSQRGRAISYFFSSLVLRRK